MNDLGTFRAGITSPREERRLVEKEKTGQPKKEGGDENGLPKVGCEYDFSFDGLNAEYQNRNSGSQGFRTSTIRPNQERPFCFSCEWSLGVVVDIS